MGGIIGIKMNKIMKCATNTHMMSSIFCNSPQTIKLNSWSVTHLTEAWDNFTTINIVSVDVTTSLDKRSSIEICYFTALSTNE